MPHYASSTIIDQQQRLIQLQEALLAERLPVVWPPQLGLRLAPVQLPQDVHHQKRADSWDTFLAWNFGLLFIGVGVLLLPVGLFIALPLHLFHSRRARYQFNGGDGRAWTWQITRYYDRGPHHHQWLAVGVWGDWVSELGLEADEEGRAWGVEATKAAAQARAEAVRERLRELLAATAPDY